MSTSLRFTEQTPWKVPARVEKDVHAMIKSARLPLVVSVDKPGEGLMGSWPSWSTYIVRGRPSSSDGHRLAAHRNLSIWTAFSLYR